MKSPAQSNQTRPSKRGRLILIIYLMGVGQFLLPAFLFMLLRSMSETPLLPPMEEQWFQLTTELLARPEASAQSREALVARVKALVGVTLTVYRPDGRLLAASADPHPPLNPEALSRLIKGGSPELTSHGFLVIPVREQGILTAYGLLRREPLDPAIMPSPPLIMIGIMLCLIALMAVLSARALGRPLAELAGAARRFGEGELGVRMRWKRPDEFGDLARAFDDMADRLTALLRSERELMANISHELRTPIARIRVALDIAEESDAETARLTLTDISQDLSELERVIDDVLTATRLDAVRVAEGGAPPLRRQNVRGADLVEAAVARFRSLHPTSPLEVKSEGPLPDLDADPALLRRVIDNLLDNARKYSEPDTIIVLEARRAQDELLISVQDQGIGIDATDLERLSTPFFRTDQSRTRASGGVGLGLTLARRILEAHGGTLRFESTPGAGTRVSVTIPGHT